VAVWANSHGLISLYLTGQFTGQIDSREAFEDFYWQAMQPMMRGLRDGVGDGGEHA
jgi:hypothetical protein